MSELHELSAGDQLRALRRREVSSTELTHHYLERIDRLDGYLGAFATVCSETALAEAARADAQLAAGGAGSLTGLPLAIKDLFSTAGIRTTFGTRALADVVPQADDSTVSRLRSAGAVLLGKTSAPEFGAACYNDGELTGRPSVTPYDLGRYASGSSSGAAAAVAARLIPLGHGSDSAGSIRTPAATCNLVGLKPSRGLISTAPRTSFFASGTEGPIARTVDDLVLGLEAMRHSSPGDLYGWSLSSPVAEAVARSADRRLRIAMWTETGVPSVSTDPEIVAATERTAGLLRDAGHDVVEIAIPAAFDEELIRSFTATFAAAVATGVAQAVPEQRRGDLTDFTTYLAACGKRLSAADLALAQARQAAYASTFLAALDGFDAALTPTTAAPPAPIGHFTTDGPDGVLGLMLAWSCHTPWANLTGQPAASVPAGFTRGGLPIGVQIVGRLRDDATILAVAAQLERLQSWSEAVPVEPDGRGSDTAPAVVGDGDADGALVRGDDALARDGEGRRT